MREIKFMAWDKEKKMWTNWKCYDNMFYFMDKNTGVWIRDDEFNRFSLIQYTGLKDKNGVEIYEGDILQDYDKNDKPITKVEVIQNNGYWDGEPLKGEHYKTCYAGYYKCKIIGNIYENPELLGVEQ